MSLRFACKKEGREKKKKKKEKRMETFYPFWNKIKRQPIRNRIIDTDPRLRIRITIELNRHAGHAFLSA